jgi:hypothetical protein
MSKPLPINHSAIPLYTVPPFYYLTEPWNKCFIYLIGLGIYKIEKSCDYNVILVSQATPFVRRLKARLILYNYSTVI